MADNRRNVVKTFKFTRAEADLLKNRAKEYDGC